MTNLNQFESAFRSADKVIYSYEPVSIERVLVVTDLETDTAEALGSQIRRFLAVIDSAGADWAIIGGAEFADVRSLLDRVERHGPDLIVTYRHLHSDGWQWPNGLGEYLDVLTQATTAPVMVLPHPDADHALPHSLHDTDRVMAITDHMAGDDRLVNHAVAFTSKEGICWLTHVESAAHFERYMEVISKIPAIDTEVARETVLNQLLKEPHDYIRTCRAALDARGIAIGIEEIVTTGRRLGEYKRLIEEHDIDLLVLYTKDEDQLAMHGLAYPLAVELRQIPLLML